MDASGIGSVPAITAICYLIAQGIKLTKLDRKWLPILCGFFGCALGVLSLFVVPGFPAQDVITASGIGIVSGLAATGANQVFKQLVK